MLKFAQPLSADDFFTGLFAALAEEGKSRITQRDTQLDAAIASVFDELKSKLPEHDLTLGFRIQIHPQHKDSATVRDGIASAARRDIVGFVNPTYQDIDLKIKPYEARFYLDGLPGGPELYRHLAKTLIEKYPAEIR